jgi:flagellar biosynthesis protein FlhG
MSVTSGKGGVGKTSTAINIAYLLTRLNKRVVILDADLGLANVDVMLGLAPRLNLFHLFEASVSLDRILFETPYGFHILPSASGVADMSALDQGQKLELLESMDYLESRIDYLIVDTGAGIDDTVVYFNLAVQERLVVLTPEPTSLTDAYALIKLLKNTHAVNTFRVVINMANSPEQAREVFKKLYLACDHFLSGITLDLVGMIPRDLSVRQAIIQQEPLCRVSPESPACRALTETAKKIANWKPPANLDGNIKFFWKQLLFQEREPLAPA